MPLGTPPPFCLSVRRRMRSLPPFLYFLLASSTAGAVAAAEQPALAVPDQAAQPPTDAQPQESNTLTIEPLTDDGAVVQDFKEGITYFRHGVMVRYRSMELVANQVAMSEATG